MLVMAAAWGRNMVSGVNTQRSIDAIRRRRSRASAGKRKLAQQLEIAGSGERIRNLAQNELACCGANARKPKRSTFRRRIKREEAQTVGQTHMEILDFLLGLLNVFHIGE